MSLENNIRFTPNYILLKDHFPESIHRKDLYEGEQKISKVASDTLEKINTKVAAGKVSHIMNEILWVVLYLQSESEYSKELFDQFVQGVKEYKKFRSWFQKNNLKNQKDIIISIKPPVGSSFQIRNPNFIEGMMSSIVLDRIPANTELLLELTNGKDPKPNRITIKRVLPKVLEFIKSNSSLKGDELFETVGYISDLGKLPIVVKDRNISRFGNEGNHRLASNLKSILKRSS